MSQDSALGRFLSKNTIRSAASMPVFHSTSGYAAKNIILSNVIDPQSCEVFSGEKINYLFYGRPSYKMKGRSQISKYWQLPSVFIFEHDIDKFDRIYPFDTGAFAEKLYPEFFNMMPRDQYEVSGVSDSPSKIISSFFVDGERYFKLKPRDKRDFESRFQIRSIDEEIKSLNEMVLSYSEDIDDRRFAIELQTKNQIRIDSGKCKAIIIPEEYLESDELVEKCESLNIEVMSYPSFPLKQEMYYYHIYNIIYELYKSWGITR